MGLRQVGRCVILFHRAGDSGETRACAHEATGRDAGHACIQQTTVVRPRHQPLRIEKM
jgi:hypothetical protein